MRQTVQTRSLVVTIGLGGLLLSGLLAGCGGATGSTPLTVPPLKSQEQVTKDQAPGGRVGILLTDSPRDDYAHLWATIHKIELLDKTEKAQTIFEDTEGVTVDVRSLHDKDGPRFALLACANVPAGRAYNRVRITLGKAFTAIAPGSTTAETLLLADRIARDTEGRPALTFPLYKPRDLGTGQEDLVIDFDLEHFTKEKGALLPAVREIPSDTISDPARQEPITFTGVVQNLAGDTPAQTFTLSPLTGEQKTADAAGTTPTNVNRSLAVQVEATTALFNAGGTTNPALSENKVVRVSGVYVPDKKRIVASQVEVVDDAKATQAATVRGVVNSATGETTFTMQTRQVSGFLPTTTAVTVTLSQDAILRSRGGTRLDKGAWATALGQAGTQVEAAGTYDAATGTLTATRARLIPTARGTAHEVTLTGTLTVGDGDTLALTDATEWDGLLAPGKNKPTLLTTTAATQYRNPKNEYLAGNSVRKAAGDKSAPTLVRITGLYEPNGTLTVTSLALLPAPPRPEPKPTVAQDDKDKAAKEGGKKAPTNAATADKPSADETDD